MPDGVKSPLTPSGLLVILAELSFKNLFLSSFNGLIVYEVLLSSLPQKQGEVKTQFLLQVYCHGQRRPW